MSETTAYIDKSWFLNEIIDGKTRSVIEYDGEAYIPDTGNAYANQFEEAMEWDLESACEDDPSRLELATFCLIYRTVSDGDIQLFVGRRIPDGEAHEERLHDLYTIGWGGGVEPQDKEGVDAVLSNAAIRELNEEVATARWVSPMFYNGLVYSEADSVSRDHIGMVWHLGTRGAEALEDDKMEGEWVDLGDFRGYDPDELVSWTRLLRDHVEEIVGL